MFERPKLGEILMRAGVIDELQLKTALGEQKRWGGRLGLALIKSGFLTEKDLVRALASQLDLPIATLEGKRISKQILGLIPPEFAHEHTVLPLFVKEEGGLDTLYVGTDDPSNLETLDDLSFRSGMQVKPVLVSPSELCEGIDRFYRGMPTGPRDVPRVEPAPNMDLPAMELGVKDDAARPINQVSGPELNDPVETSSAASAPPAPATTLESSAPRLLLRALTEALIAQGLVDGADLSARVSALKAAEEEL